MAQYAVYTAEGRKRKTLYGKTHQEVATKLARALSDREGGLIIFDAGNQSVGEYMDRWLNDSLNAWCELRSPTQQVCKGQARTTELIVEPDAEVVQRHPRRQASPQSLKLMGPLPPEAEGVEQLLVDALHDLADARDPPPQTFGPASLAGVAFGRMDDVRSVTLEPPEVVFSALEALVGYVGSRSGRAHADEPSVGLGSQDEEGFRHLLVGCGSGREAEARYDPGRVRGGQQAETFVPSQAVGPSDVRTTGQPSMSPALTVSD